MVDQQGLEPWTIRLWAERSNRLSYWSKIFYGRCGGTRTHGKSGMNRVLYQLSYAATWWTWPGSNRLPPECKSGALPGELQAQYKWSGWQDLNLRPSAPKADAIPSYATSRNSCNGAPDTDRTCNPQIRSLILYPIELQAHIIRQFAYIY